MSLYQLKAGVFLVEGAFYGAILDTNTGLIYSVNKQACAVLNYEVQDILYWQTLVSMELAEQTTKVRLQNLPKRNDSNGLKFVWFEVVTDDCNERCVHCYADSMPKTYRNALVKQGHFVATEQLQLSTSNEKPRMSHSDWLNAIKDAYLLGCKSCQFIGGEPLLYKGEKGETIFDLVNYARQTGYSSIEIYTNATLLTAEKVELIKKLEAKVAVSLYSNDPNTHDNITRTPGSHAKTVNALRLLKEFGVTTRVEMILMKSNQNTIETTLELRKELGHRGRNPDPLRPKGRGDNPLLQPSFDNLVKYGLKLKPNFTASLNTISHYTSGHSCLLGKITITEFGDVLPCIFSRNHSVGNVLISKSLKQIIEGQELHRIWLSTKDNVLVCRDCEYRYVCFDCRPLSEGVAAGNANYLNAPYPRCTYNPYTGEWGGGLWKVNENGDPFYDRSLAPEIQLIAQNTTIDLQEEISH